ncbi:MAG: YHYH protein [Pseudomonadota bacterium]
MQKIKRTLTAVAFFSLTACGSSGGTDDTAPLPSSTSPGTAAADPTPLEAGVDYTAMADFSARDNWTCDNEIVTDNITGAVLEPDVTEATNNAALTRDFDSNSIPAHRVGDFPNSGNPNAIGAFNVSYDIALRVEAERPDRLTSNAANHVAISVGGILFEPNTAEFYNNDRNSGWNYEALTIGAAANDDLSGAIGYLGTDCNSAHVQPTGKYHYHGMPEELVADLLDATGNDINNPAMVLVGYAADGYPVYARWAYVDPMDASSGLTVMRGSFELIAGTRPSGPGGTYDGTFVQDWEYVANSGDLDECNGRYGVTPEYPGGIYHYFVTDDYPFLQRCVWGSPSPDALIGGN